MNKFKSEEFQHTWDLEKFVNTNEVLAVSVVDLGPSYYRRFRLFYYEKNDKENL